MEGSDEERGLSFIRRFSAGDSTSFTVERSTWLQSYTVYVYRNASMCMFEVCFRGDSALIWMLL